MKIVGKNISMTRGDSETITVSCIDINGLPLPLVNGDIIYFTVKDNANTAIKIIQKAIDTFTDGKAIISILPSDTHELKYKTYLYDIQLNRHDGTVTTIITPSNFTITEEVTYE